MQKGVGGINIRIKRKKNEKGERKKQENYIKKGGSLKNASFWAINFAPPAANLFVGGKK